MSEAIRVALITLAGVICTAGASIVVQVIISRRSQAEVLASLRRQSELDDAHLDAKLEKHQAITDVKIDELTREVRDHNNFARRMPVVEEQIKVINHRIEDLEREGQKNA